MTAGRLLLRNTAVLVGAHGVSVLTGLVTTIFLARVLGPAGYGVLGFGIALVSYLGLAVNLGMDVHAVREVAKSPESGRHIVNMVLTNRLVVATVMIGAIYLLSPHLGWSADAEKVVRIQVLGLIGTALLVDFYFQSRQRMEVLAVRQVVAALAAMVAVLALVRGAGDLEVAAAIPVAALVASAVVLFAYFVFRGVAPSGQRPREGRLGFIRRSAPLALISVLVTILVNLDIVILGYLVTEDRLGLYVAATRVLAVAVILPGLLHSVFYPALAEAMSDDARRSRLAEDLSRVLAFFGCVIAGAGVILAPVVIPLLFGGAYDGSAGAMRILLVHAAFVFLTSAYGTALLAWNGDKPYTILLSIGAVLNVALNFLLIPHFGIEGAAMATLASQVVMWLSLSAVVRKAYDLKLLGNQIRALSAAAVAAVPAYALLANLPMPGPLAPVAATLVYVAALAVLSQVSGVIDLSRLASLVRLRR